MLNIANIYHPVCLKYLQKLTTAAKITIFVVKNREEEANGFLSLYDIQSVFNYSQNNQDI